jgi:hypothetical protein
MSMAYTKTWACAQVVFAISACFTVLQLLPKNMVDHNINPAAKELV